MGTPLPRPRRWGKRLVLLVAILAAGGFLLWQWRRIERQADRMTALTLAEQGHFAQAEPLLVQALAHDSTDLPVVKALATGRLAQDADAEPFLARWIELDPHDALPYRLRMEMWARLFKRKAALADGLRVLALEPANDRVRRNVAWMLLAVGRLDEAEREARIGLQHLPSDADFPHILAEVLHVKGQPAQAAAVLDQLLAQHPGHTPGLLLRGRLYRDMKQPEQALPLLRRVIAESADSKDRQAARYHLAQALSRCGKPEEAEAVLREFRRVQEAERLFSDSEQQPDNHELHLRAAQELIATGEPDKAVKLLTGLLQRVPDYQPAHQLLARYYESQGQPALAAPHRRASQPR